MITDVAFEAFLNCPMKAWNYASDSEFPPSEYSLWQQQKFESYVGICFTKLKAKMAEKICLSNLTLDSMTDRNFQLLLNSKIQTQEIDSRIHCIESVSSTDDAILFIPMRFVAREKLIKQDKIMLGFDAIALSKFTNQLPSFGKIMHGCNMKVVKVNLLKIIPVVQELLEKLKTQQIADTPPPLVLNKHCIECEYQQSCRQKAIKNDDLSLISSMTEKERSKLHTKGIFSITQLSYTFRARRKSSHSLSKKKTTSHPLRALAIREQKIHVVDSPKLNLTGTPVYIDVEGNTDLGFYYLIGLRFNNGESSKTLSFWANDVDDEVNIWHSFLVTIAELENPQLVYYGSYEKVFLESMRQRYGNANVQANFLDNLQAQAINLLSVLYAQIYFPTFTNNLKEIARFLGFQWTDTDASGIASLMWRSQWENSKNSSLKEKLVTYNAEDCEATEAVTNFLVQLISNQTAGTSFDNHDIVNTDSLESTYPFQLTFRKNEFALPEFDYINKAAYWDYQQERVYFRTKKKCRTTSKKDRAIKKIRINKTVHFEPTESIYCTKCKSKHVHKKDKNNKILYDLKFSDGSVKRWVVKYLYPKYHCQACNNYDFKKFFPWESSKYGWNVVAYIIYCIIDLQISHRAITQNLHQLFGFSLVKSTIARIKSDATKHYSETYMNILKKLQRGKLIHADETSVKLKKKSGYVWVLTSFEEIIYFYTNTREGSKLKESLKEFNGVLVSDFYSVYDAIDCPQQKCLIHLMRDLNDSLHKEPFNQELKDITQTFASLLKPMIETIDRFGLKIYFLKKHKAEVQRFYQKLSNQDYKTEITQKIFQRLTKNQSKLFTFLDYDNVPWNNNNAEHAVKAFAALRKPLRGLSTEKGMRDYLTLLSIRETCKLRNIDFLKFLRSRETDLEGFV